MFLSWFIPGPRPWSPPLSNRKLSETLLDFAAPVTAHLPFDVEPKRLERHLRFAVAVWNRLVVEEWGAQGVGHMATARASVRGLDPSISPFAEGLLSLLASRRRKRRFRGDLRAITSLSVRVAPLTGELRIRAEASLPEALRLHYGLPERYPATGQEPAPPSGPRRRRRHR